MKTVSYMFAGLIVAGVLFGSQPCPEQAFLPTLNTMDPNRIELDPVSGERLLVKTYTAVVGEPCLIVGRACDPDVNDVLHVWRLPDGPEIPLGPNGGFEIAFTPTSEGWTYLGVGVTDGIAIRKGTYAVYSRINHPPSLCGGLTQ